MRAFTIIHHVILLILPVNPSAMASAAGSDGDDGTFIIVRRPLSPNPNSARSLSLVPRAAGNNAEVATSFAAGTTSPDFEEAVAAIRAVSLLTAPAPGSGPHPPGSAEYKASTGEVLAGADDGVPPGSSLDQRWGYDGGGWSCVNRNGYSYCGGPRWGAGSRLDRPGLWVVMAGTVGAVAAVAWC